MDIESSENVQKWLAHISAYEKEFRKWETKSEKIVKRFGNDTKTGNSDHQESKFNILWSNVQTLTAATFSRLPKPDVSRRFKDQDAIGRVAALILERASEYEIQKYTDYRSTLKACILDRFLGGRGTAWVRYEPHFRAAKANIPIDGLQITEDTESPGEELDYECAPCDYVHWKDFGHVVARTWEEVPAVWRKVYLRKDQCEERFGKEIGSKIPLDSIPEDSKEKTLSNNAEDDRSRACIYEIWDKTEKKAIWISKSTKEILDEKDDPLGLEEFFPCPKPLFSTLTNDSLVPIPDFTFYQDQANELDLICDRIDGLVKALKVSGVYDASVGDLQRLFTEGDANTLIPVKNWTAFTEKNGLKGSIDLVDLAPIASALNEAYTAMDHVKSQIYEITGIADIIRGQTQVLETATAQQMKGQYATLRLKTYQEEVARFSTELLQIKSQIICGKFAPQTILSISAADQLNPSDQQNIQPALQLLIGQERMLNPEASEGPNPLRSFRVEVAADSLVYLDEQEEKQSRVELLTAVGTFLSQAVQAATQAPQMTPVLMELLKFGVTGFRVGKSIEGLFDSVTEQLKQQATQPKPPDPQQQADAMKARSDQMKSQADQQKIQGQIQTEAIKGRNAQISAQAESVRAQADVIRSHNEVKKATIESMKPHPIIPNA